MNDTLPLGKLEALLFLHGEPITFKKIEDLLELKAGQAEKMARELAAQYEEGERGLSVMIYEGKVQLVTRKEFHVLAEKFIKEELDSDLTPASLETLSLVLYFGPISRSKLEYIRGVNSIFTLRNLTIRGLVERKADPAHPQSFVYQPTFAAMRHLGITRQGELPQFEKFRTLLGKVEESGTVKEGETPII